jgi:hypothetical protein
MIKKTSKVETSYEEREKARQKKRLDEANAIKQKEIAKINEKKQAIETIVPYLKSLRMQLKNKHRLDFWSFPDRSGFKKISSRFDDMQKMVQEDVEKYANRKICLFSIAIYLNPKEYKDFDHDWLVVNMDIFHLDDKAKLNGKNKGWSSCYSWRDEDFKITRFTFNLLEEIMHIVADKKHIFPNITGMPLHHVINDLKKKKISIAHVLNPLVGL